MLRVPRYQHPEGRSPYTSLLHRSPVFPRNDHEDECLFFYSDIEPEEFYQASKSLQQEEQETD